MNFDSSPANALNRSLEDPRTPELASGAVALYECLATYLARVGGRHEALNPLARNLAQRIGEADARAPMEFWRLLQGLHYGGVLSADSLAHLEEQLSALRPQWRTL
ncbi:hypothetical protein QZH45_21490 [Pseudomonas corrugata]|uniref:hypothetical protein n=1 Tax=Pseudomonas corrugata TaxID=47879 RepID=UPI003D815080